MTDNRNPHVEGHDAFYLGAPDPTDNLNLPLARVNYADVRWSRSSHNAWFVLKETKFGRSKLVRTVHLDRTGEGRHSFTVVDQKGHLMHCETAEVVRNGLQQFSGTVDDWGDDLPVTLS